MKLAGAVFSYGDDNVLDSYQFIQSKIILNGASTEANGMEKLDPGG